MKWSSKKYEPFSLCYRVTGRKRGWKAEVIFSEWTKTYHFLCEKGDRVFNSLWKEMKYKTEEACRIACEKWIEESEDKA